MSLRGSSPRHIFLLALSAVFALQLAWIIAVPPFRGIDEFDHAYKAAAVSRGEFTTRGPAQHGGGGLVAVPVSLVHAASAACTHRSYTGRDNCYPVERIAPGIVTVATTAGAYDPAWYLVAGSVARPFSGAAADFVMRLVTALLAGAMIAWAAALAAREWSSRWALLSLGVAATPVLIYSTSIASPNGVHYAAGLLVWTALLTLAAGTAKSDRSPLLPLTVGTGALVVTHSTGPMWLVLIAAAALCLRSPRWWLEEVRKRPLGWCAALAAMTVMTLASLLWTMTAHTNALGPPRERVDPLTAPRLIGAEVVWLLQEVGAFPMRDEPAPSTTYAIWIAFFLTLLSVGVRYAAKGERRALVVVALLSVLVPSALSVYAYESLGLAWQGRYTLPLSTGLPLICGWLLARREVPVPRWAVVFFWVGATVASVVSLLHVYARENAVEGVRPLVASLPLGAAVIAALPALAGVLFIRANSLVPAPTQLRAQRERVVA